MKYKIIILFTCLSAIGFYASAQRATPTSQDATKRKLAASLNAVTVTGTTGTAGQAGVKYTISGTFSDPSALFTRAGVTTQMHYLDGNCKMYVIESVTTSGISGLILGISPLGTSAAELGLPSTVPGLIFDPTPNLILPQWVFGIAPRLQNCLLSHMASILDAKLSAGSEETMSIKTANYTILPTDNTVLFNAASAALTATLPDASANAGKSIKIGKIDDSSNTLTFSPAIRFAPGTSGTIGTLNYARTFIIQSDGTDWWVVNQF